LDFDISAGVAICLMIESIFGVAHWRNENKLRPLRAEQARIHENELAAFAAVAADANSRAGRARRDAATANERAAALEKEAESARAAIADANARAIEAQLALEKYKAPRSLTKEQQDRIVENIKLFAGQEYALSVAVGAEAENFLCMLDGILQSAGWKKHDPFGTIHTGTACGRVALNSLSGVHIRAAPTLPAAGNVAANALGPALVAEGIAAVGEIDPQNIPVETVINVMVGSKP
jgi:hypothetical protein